MTSASSGEALLVEHLRYTPLSLIDDVINTINAIVYRAINSIEAWMLAQPAATLGFEHNDGVGDDDDNDDAEERQRMEIEEGLHQLETLLEATVDKTFDKFEIYTLRNLLRVPDGLEKWVRLRHYEGLTLPLTADTASRDSITQLRRRLQATQKLHLSLSHTHASNDLLLTQLRGLLASPPDGPAGPLSHLLATTSSSPSDGHLQPAAQFTKAQLPALKALLDELRPRVSAVAGLAETGAAAAPRRDERVRYVEEVVDRVVGTQIGKATERDDGLGAVRREEEVRGLEGVVGGSGRRDGEEREEKSRDDENDEDEPDVMEE